MKQAISLVTAVLFSLGLLVGVSNYHASAPGDPVGVANFTQPEQADAATQTVYNLSTSTKTFRVYWSTNCTGSYKTVPLGGKVTGGGKYFLSYRQPAYTFGKQYIGVFTYDIGPVTHDTCRSDRRGPFAWEKFKWYNTGQGSW